MFTVTPVFPFWSCFPVFLFDSFTSGKLTNDLLPVYIRLGGGPFLVCPQISAILGFSPGSLEIVHRCFKEWDANIRLSEYLGEETHVWGLLTALAHGDYFRNVNHLCSCPVFSTILSKTKTHFTIHDEVEMGGAVWISWVCQVTTYEFICIDGCAHVPEKWQLTGLAWAVLPKQTWGKGMMKSRMYLNSL